VTKTSGPGTNQAALHGKLLDIRARLEAKKAAQTAEVEATAHEPTAEPGAPKSEDGFHGVQSGLSVPELADERGGGVKARLHAMGLKGDALIKTNKDRVRITETPAGKILEGAVMAETAAGLQKLNGVVKAHEIGLQEPLIKSADLLVLKTLIEVDRFTIEGSPTLTSLDALAALERGRSIYIGFNATLGKIVLPRLKEVDVLIIEGNPKLREIVLPALEVVHRYVHIQDNVGLDAVSIGKREKPVKCPELELSGNAQKNYANIFYES
jgi:hypothetical protein